MKEIFSSYFPPTPEQFSELWDNCLFVIDANVLLDLYRYPPKVREELFDVLTGLGDRLWVPHQAVLEYINNRHTNINSQKDQFKIVRDALSDIRDKVKEQLNKKINFQNHPVLDKQAVIDQVLDALDALDDVIDSIDERKQEYTLSPDDDPIFDRVTSLLEGKIGSPYTLKRRKKIYIKGEIRYALEIPPGFRDIDKPGYNRYGDLVLWFQVIDKAKEIKKPIILVTGEKKEDWWRKDGRSKLGPRPELIDEMRERADVLFHLYHTDEFIRRAKQYLNIQIDEEVIEKIEEIRRQDEAEELAIEQARRVAITPDLLNELVRLRATEIAKLTSGVGDAMEGATAEIGKSLAGTWFSFSPLEEVANNLKFGFLEQQQKIFENFYSRAERNRKAILSGYREFEQQQKALSEHQAKVLDDALREPRRQMEALGDALGKSAGLIPETEVTDEPSSSDEPDDAGNDEEE